MAENTEETNPQQNSEDAQNASSYTMDDAMQVTDAILKLTDENKYKVGAFVHGMILAEEYAQMMYHIPQQQIAQIRRDCRNYIRELMELQQKVAQQQTQESASDGVQEDSASVQDETISTSE